MTWLGGGGGLLLVLLVLYLFARRTEHLEERVADLEDKDEGPGYDEYGDPR